MEVTASSFRLLTLVVILLGFHVQVRDAAFRIVPNRLQFFEFESVFFHCEGLNASARLRGIRNAVQFLSACQERNRVMSCSVHRAYAADAGEYWCETQGGERSDSVNISVTDGPVVLDSPVLPVTEGDSITLSCRTKTSTSSSTLRTDFYKDDLFMRSSSTAEMIIRRVSQSDEGLYKCRISDGGESPTSRLTVTALQRDTCTFSDNFMRVLLVIRTVFTVVMVALLLLLLGLLHYGKLKVAQA